MDRALDQRSDCGAALGFAHSAHGIDPVWGEQGGNGIVLPSRGHLGLCDPYLLGTSRTHAGSPGR